MLRTTITEAKRNLYKIAKDIVDLQETVTVYKYGRPSAVMMSLDE